MSDIICVRDKQFEIQGLIDLLAYIEKHGVDLRKAVMVEIESYAGDSSKIFASFVNKIYCIDPFVNGYDDSDQCSYKYDMKAVEKQFDLNTKNFNNVKKVKMTSRLATNLFKDSSLDFVYIDGDHRYEKVKEDILLWLPKIKPSGFLCGHDYNHPWAPKVSCAVEEIIEKPNCLFVDTSWIKSVRAIKDILS